MLTTESRIKALEGENKKLSDFIELLRESAIQMESEHTDMRLAKQELEGRLEAIRQHYHVLDDWTYSPANMANWLSGLGVLLNSETSDVAASLKEIGEGKSKKFTNPDELLKELKSEEKK